MKKIINENFLLKDEYGGKLPNQCDFAKIKERAEAA